MNIKIEKGLPVPTKRSGPTKYPFADMTTGDSFFVAGANSSALWGSIWSYKNRHGGNFTARTVTENGVKGVRVWRVK